MTRASIIGNPGWGVWLIVGVFCVEKVVMGIFLVIVWADSIPDGLDEADRWTATLN